MQTEANKQVIAYVVIFCAVTLFVLLLVVEVPKEVRDTLLISFGVFIAKFQTVVDYFFGSSEGSREKTKMINKGE